MFCHDQFPPIDLTKISPLSILSGEHRVILQVLSCMERMAARSAESDGIPVAHAEQALEVLRTFADRCHHGKEEELLFPALEAQVHGFPPSHVMRHEHVIGRSLIQKISESVVARDASAFREHAIDYVELLRNHIAKEDGVLFPMADRILDSEEQNQLLEAYRRVEHDDMGSGTHERMLGIADALATAYGVPRVSDDPVVFTLLTACCGCHARRSEENHASL